MVCRVCGLCDDGFHFKVLSCRACAAFFRRSIVRKTSYICKSGKTCPINNELRKSCAACRFVKCKEVGMCENDVQWNRDANGPLKYPRHTESVRIAKNRPEIDTVFQNVFSISSIPWSNSSISSVPATTSSCSSPPDQQITYLQPNTSLLNKLHEYVQQYFRGEKALYMMLYPDRSCDGDVISFHPIKHSELIEMEKGCLSLIQQLIFQINPSIELLSPDLKLILLRSFFNLFSPLRKTYLTSKVFPDETDRRFAFHFGQYISADTGFFADDKDPKTSFDICNNLASKSMFTVNKLRKIALREIEFAALVGLILSNEVDLLFNNDSMSGFRDQIFRELDENILSNYVTDGPNRFGAIICLLQYVWELSLEVNLAVEGCKLFSPHQSELWD